MLAITLQMPVEIGRIANGYMKSILAASSERLPYVAVCQCFPVHTSQAGPIECDRASHLDTAQSDRVLIHSIKLLATHAAQAHIRHCAKSATHNYIMSPHIAESVCGLYLVEDRCLGS